jgi:hypothetical protein
MGSCNADVPFTINETSASVAYIIDLAMYSGLADHVMIYV